jgi:hypothetical protein
LTFKKKIKKKLLIIKLGIIYKLLERREGGRARDGGSLKKRWIKSSKNIVQ